jgi:hypothetical protein
MHDIVNVSSVLLCQWRHTHSTIVYMTLVMPRLSYYVSEDTQDRQGITNVLHSNILCECLHWHNRTDEALPMSCMLNVSSVLLCQWRHTHSTFVYRTLVMPRLSYYVNEETHSTFVFMIFLYTNVLYVCLHWHTQNRRVITNILYTNVLCVCLHWHNRREEALPMSCI